MGARQPIYLLADSQLLFWKDPRRGELSFLDAITHSHSSPSPRAAYIGASNGDVPAYYEIFAAAMSAAGISEHRMIRSQFPPGDEAFLSTADIVLLAGGDVEAGWRIINGTGMRELIVRRHDAGATLIGISAGAVQLGLHGVVDTSGSIPTLFDTFQLCPFVVGAHDEATEWRELVDVVRSLNGRARGIGIRSGAGVIAHPNGRLEAVRHPADEFVCLDGVVERRVLPVTR